jgi:MFS family permease
VREDFMSGVRSGVNGTPTFFINGVRFDDSWDPDTLTERVEGRFPATQDLKPYQVVLSALRFRNFRLLWIGVGVSFAGSFMQQAALLWHVSLLVPDHKGLALGLVGLVRVVPIIAFSLVSGVAADTFDRRKLMLITQIGGATVAAVLAVLAFRGLTAVWPIYLLAAIGASVGAFDPPARHALVPMLGTARASTERDQPQHRDDSGRVSRRARRLAASSSPSAMSAGPMPSTPPPSYVSSRR